MTRCRVPGPRRRAAWAAGVLVAIMASATFAQPTWPARTIRIVVPYAAGGGVDTVARTVGQKLAQRLEQAVVIDNRPGASGAIGCEVVARATPDGYTLLANFGPSHHTIQFFAKGTPYDPVRDFTAVSIVGTAPQVIVVPASAPVRTVSELLDLMRRNPASATYGTSGVGTSQHIGGLTLAQAGNLTLTHVAYKGGSAALNDLLGGQIPAAILVLSNVAPHIATGRLRALGVLESHRARSVPAIPTVAENGMPGFAVPDTWAGFLAPAGLPLPIVRRLNAEILAAIEAPEVKARLEAAGFEVEGRGPEAFAEELSGSVETFRRIVTQAGIRPE